VQLQQTKLFPLLVHYFSDYLDVFGAGCVLGAWRRSAGSEKGAKDRQYMNLYICVFIEWRMLTQSLHFLQVSTYSKNL